MAGIVPTRLAILIDADNTTARLAGTLLAEIAKYETPTVKRAYGDWTTQHLAGWKAELLLHAVQPVQQFAYTSGKNSTRLPFLRAVDAALQTEVVALAGAGIDVDAIHAQRRRSEEPLDLSRPRRQAPRQSSSCGSARCVMAAPWSAARSLSSPEAPEATTP